MACSLHTGCRLRRQGEEIGDAATNADSVQAMRPIMLRTCAVASVLAIGDTEREQAVRDVLEGR